MIKKLKAIDFFELPKSLDTFFLFYYQFQPVFFYIDTNFKSVNYKMLKLKYLKTIKGVGCNSSRWRRLKNFNIERGKFRGVALPPLWGASP